MRGLVEQHELVLERRRGPEPRSAQRSTTRPSRRRGQIGIEVARTRRAPVRRAGPRAAAQPGLEPIRIGRSANPVCQPIARVLVDVVVAVEAEDDFAEAQVAGEQRAELALGQQLDAQDPVEVDDADHHVGDLAGSVRHPDRLREPVRLARNSA